MEISSALISKLDVICSFAQIAQAGSILWTKPVFREEGGIDIKGSRHPLLEANPKSECVSNSCRMERVDSLLHIITGPNMGGKSTYIRQIAITILLAHIGSFVPCE